MMRRHARGHRDRVDRRVVEQVVEVGGEPRLRILRGIALAALGREVAAPGEVGDARHVAHDVGSPVAEAHDADANAHSLTTLSLDVPAAPVALRKSTTSLARSTTSAKSIELWSVTTTT